jgi:nucleoside-diphosphate-sugar epimerase
VITSTNTPNTARLLIVGFGDIGKRVATRLCAPQGYAVDALIRNPDAEKIASARMTGANSLAGDLSNPASIGHLQKAAYEAVMHFAPPQSGGDDDIHTRNLLATLPASVKRIVYISTTGVYGDCGDAWIDESQPLNPTTDRAKRRVSAEAQLTQWCLARGAVLTILRAPGIYAADRLPIERLKAGTPALCDEDDVFTNHIHADDLASAAIMALSRMTSATFNIVDDSDLKMAAYFDLVADHFGLPHPPRISRADAAKTISPAMLSFMRESRRIRNDKMKRELGLTLRYPAVADCLREIDASGGD